MNPDTRIKIIKRATDTQLLDWCERMELSCYADQRYPGLWLVSWREGTTQYSFGADTLRDAMRGLILSLFDKNKFTP